MTRLNPRISFSSPETPALLCGLVYATAFLALATVLIGHFGFPLDDSWIHQVIARNFVRYHVLGFTPGRLTSGSTSLLWTAILSAGEILFPRASPIIFCVCLNAALLFGIGFVFKRLTEEDRLPASASWCVAVAPALSGNFLWLGLTGMEHVLFILLCLCVVRQWTLPVAKRGRGHSAVLFFLGLLLVLTRPEGCVLLVLLVGVGTVFFRSVFASSVIDRVTAVLGGACSLAVTAWVNWRTSGKLAPPTMAGRRLLAPTRLNYLVQSWFQVVKSWDYRRFSPDYARHPRVAIELPLFLLLLCLILIALHQLKSSYAFRVLFLCLWSGTIIIMYGVELPSPGHGGRYIAFPLMLCMSLLMLGIASVLNFLLRAHRRPEFALAAVMVFMAVESGYQWRRAAAGDIDQINSEHGSTAEWLQATLPPEEFLSPRVAVFDIGRIGYKFQGNLIDLGALVDPGFLPYLLSHRTVDYLQQRNVRYLVIPGRNAAPPGRPFTDDMHFEELLSLKGNPEISLNLLHMICSDAEAAKIGLSSTGTAFPCQRIYQVSYNSHLVSSRELLK